MKIVFASNYYNHHQQAVSAVWDDITCHNYLFIATSEMRVERRELGYGMNGIPSFVKYTYKNPEERDVCMREICEADAVIAGAAPEKMLWDRMYSNKLTFRYTERPFKKELPACKYIFQWLRMHLRNPMGKPLYLLCAGAYTASDYHKFGLFRNKAYRWGYFPAAIRYAFADDLLQNKDYNAILWAGRFIDWKHPEQAILVAKRLKEAGYHFSLKLIGSGEMENKLQQLILEHQLEDCVHILGSMKPEQVRKHMEKARIFLFTSDKQEGWGAVLNESMNSGCAVVASHAIGSVPYLVEDGKNGLVYRSGDVNMLYEKVKFLLDNPQQQTLLGKSAYETIVNEWNAEIAAERLCNLASHILQGEEHPDLYTSGPCSRAPILKDDWM